MKLNFIGGLVIGSLVTAGILITLFSIQGTGETNNEDHQNLGSADQGVVERGNPSASLGDTNKSPGSIEPQDFSSQPVSPAVQQEPVLKGAGYAATCDQNCIDNLVGKFIVGADLSPADWDNIRDTSDIIAASLSSDPDALRSLRDTISYSSEEGQIDGLLTIVSALPGESALEIIRDVSSYSSTHKALALQALAGLSLYSQGAAREIESLVIGERDPAVISAALDALETTDNYEFSPETWRSLSEQFSYVQDSQLKSSILMSLAKHGKSDPVALTNNVQDGLNSDSSDLQRASIEALGYLISRSENEDSLAPIVKSDGLESQLKAIADNPDAESSVRIEALTLLEEAF